MNDKTINKLILIQENIKKPILKTKSPTNNLYFKTFALSKISPLISGHGHFGKTKCKSRTKVA